MDLAAKITAESDPHRGKFRPPKTQAASTTKGGKGSTVRETGESGRVDLVILGLRRPRHSTLFKRIVPYGAVFDGGDASVERIKCHDVYMESVMMNTN